MLLIMSQHGTYQQHDQFPKKSRPSQPNLDENRIATHLHTVELQKMFYS